MDKTYIAKIKSGHTVKQVSVVGGNVESAKKVARKSGHVITIKKQSSINFSSGLTVQERQTFFMRLSSMLQSKVGTSESLKLIKDTYKGRIAEIAGKLLNLVETGMDLATAIEKVGQPNFPTSTVALIKAGSKSGETWRSLNDAASFEVEMEVVKKNASKGIIPGIIGFIFAAVTNMAATFYVAPEIMNSELIKGLSKPGEETVMTSLISFGNFVTWLIVVLAIFVMALLLLSTVFRKIAPDTADHLIMKIPFYKDMVLARDSFITLYGLSLLVKSGVRIEESLRLTGENAKKGALRNDILRAYAAVKTGKPWPMMMKTFHPTDKASLMCANDREQTATTLTALANHYKHLYAQRMGMFSPILYFVVVILLCFAAFMLFAVPTLPILELASKSYT